MLVVLVVAPTMVRSESVRVETSLLVAETFSDNAGAGRNGQSDWITEISPTVSIGRMGGRVSGDLNASFRNRIYLQEASRNSSFLSLTGNGKAELIENSLFVDMKALLDRTNLSSFVGRAQWDDSNTSSRSETRYVSFSPYWVMHPGGSGDLQASVRYSGEALSYGSGMRSQGRNALTANLSDPTAGELVGWSLDYNRSAHSYRNGGGDATDTSLQGTLTFNVAPQFSLRGIVGTETNNYRTGSEERGTITGYGFSWHPTPRTNIDGTYRNRQYGDTYDFKFTHRRTSSAFDLSYKQDINSSFQSATNTIGSYYYELFSSSLLAQFPDPVQRDQAVRDLMTALGIPTQGVFGNFASNAFFMEKRLQAGVSLIGVRNTLALNAYRSERQRANPALVTSPNDDFAANDHIESRGATLSLSHRLTPVSGLNAALFWSRSEGSGAGRARSGRHNGLTIGYTTQLNPQSSFTVHLRRQNSEGDNKFTENSIKASLSRSF